jgi:antitoxin component YwqK of YwqJK toxin-antitoxin module
MRINFDELDFTDELHTWKGHPFTGIACEYNDQGKLISEVPFVEGFKEGVEREWYPSGQLRREKHLRGAGLHGVLREWFETGQLQIEAYYEYAILVKKKEWDENGKLILKKHISENDALYEVLKKRKKRKPHY